MLDTVFKKVIDSEEELRLLLGTPSRTAANKIIHKLDHHCREFIGQSPILFLSTADSAGRCDTSPRGDAPGFVHILDDHTFVIPERPGNKRMDSLLNILSNPHVGLLFAIPGLEETLRINGHARIIRDSKILEQMAAYGKNPILGIAVEVDECYIHCAKAFKRSKLWDQSHWLDKQDLPKPAQILADHVNLPGLDSEKIENALLESYEKRLY
ncbi:pyridoxamine 5'-phosphate oxidase family protein [Bacillus sp. ISL-47]|uniref:pyridoxamine 5'-phosphate oxidase family protein n=1 Tax=Bacillus sp. ISL-47 TaxID=2819130 RepID=UPI001BEB3282|nr:pyridoxamine 5'-phosphate oxidase family protein [Bacillus sp. ISL-47]MBT2687703.1 pyridoxamine 5'-phosphate oxidase family protein [Bacillus sp. ISL-47]MBT2707422.1 pyridoxamine 5'-phosphate oxidase family protein [Pseudomonas sp. ISL-84]